MHATLQHTSKIHEILHRINYFHLHATVIDSSHKIRSVLYH